MNSKLKDTDRSGFREVSSSGCTEEAVEFLSALMKSEVHVWIGDLDSTIEHDPCLSSDELRTRARFRFDQDRERWTAAHVILRKISSEYLRVHPRDIQFERDHAFGKPSFRFADLQFNISHSGNVGLFAFAWESRVGVDVEEKRPDLDILGLAMAFFAPEELEALRAVDPLRQVDAFFNAWTQKEALIKGRGEGLAIPLDTFVVSVDPDLPGTLLKAKEELKGWSVRRVPVPAGYAAAVAVDSDAFDLRVLSYSTNPAL